MAQRNAPLGTLKMDEFASRSMTYGTDTTGGYVVEETVPTAVYKYLESWGGVRRAGATVLSIGGDVKVPFQANAVVTSTAPTAEGTAIAEESVTLGALELSARSYPANIPMTDPILMSTHGAMLRNFVVAYLTERVGKTTENFFLSGNGTGGQPTGILHNPATTVTTNATDAVTGDDIADLITSNGALLENPNSVLMFNSSLLGPILKTATSANSQLMIDEVSGAATQYIYGQRVIFNDLMPGLTPAFTTGQNTVIYGVFSAGYVIGELSTFRFEVERVASEGRSKLVGTAILDGGVRDVNAFRVLTQKS